MPPVDKAWRRLNRPTQVWPSVLKTDRSGREWFEMTYNNHILKYTVAVYGLQDTENGFPLYIGLHRGGGEKSTGDDVKSKEQRAWRIGDNDRNWWDMAERYYRDPVRNFSGPEGASQEGGGKGAVYIAVRGVSSIGSNGTVFDDWNLHSQPESFVLVERMVRNMFEPNPIELYQSTDYSKLLSGAKSLVDANRVYLLGFAAGGDGAFQFAGRLPDLFAAVNAGGGHPNGISFTNTSNLPLSLQVGEADDTIKDRARIYGQVHFDLLTRQAALDSRGFNDRYVHETCIVRGGGHEDWSQPGVVNQNQSILSKLHTWFYEPDQPDAEDAVQKLIAPVPWVSSHTRDPYPPVVVWDLSTRPPPPKILNTTPPTTWQPNRFCYWLYIRSEDAAAPHQDTITASYDKDTNSVKVDKAKDYLGIFLHPKMFDFNNDIHVYVGEEKIGSVRPKLVINIATGTWNLHHDKYLIFSSMIYFENVEGKWTVKNAESFDTKPKPISSKL